MAGIYQEIWNADQAGNGVEAILDTERGSRDHGYVKVNSALTESSDPDLRVLTEVHIPERKRRTYELCRRLFNNYSLAEPMPEHDTPEERQEVHDFVTAVLDTEPMEVARHFVARATGSTVSRSRWHNTVVEMWFRRFASGGDPALTGFEHVVVGEQERSKVQGYHFWWKYYLDDGFARRVDEERLPLPADGERQVRLRHRWDLSDRYLMPEDRIRYHGSKQDAGQLRFPESVTISWRWHAPDYEANAFRPLTKKIGGFFVGCSVEGLMALGTVRAHKGVRAPQVAVIEGARYDMKLYHSPSGQQVRTFYPVFLGAADPADGGARDTPPLPPPAPVPAPGPVGGDAAPVPVGGDAGAGPAVLSPVRIIAAMVNPPGGDAGLETVTLVNVSPDATDWSLRDRNDRRHVIEQRQLRPGEFHAVRLSGRDVQLSNKGGEICLHDAAGALAHRVSYSRSQASRQGATVLF